MMKSLLHKIIQNRVLQVLAVLLLFCLSAPYLPFGALQGLYTISVFIKELLMWFLPISVCVYIANTLAAFKKKAVFLLLTLFFFEAFSNAISILYVYVFGSSIESLLPNIHTGEIKFSELHPFLDFSKWRPKYWTADKGVLLGILLGLIYAFSKEKFSTIRIFTFKKTEYILTKIFARLIPIFVLGFLAQLYTRNNLIHSFSQYGIMIFWIIIAVLLYLLALFLLAAKGNIHRMLYNVWNVLPAAGMAFTSGCSLSTMPLTIAGVSKNLNNPFFAQMIIPATTNIQQIGDCIVNTLLCLMIMREFNQSWPDFNQWSAFLIVFVLARFTTAAVLGGAIFIMLPVYEKYLSFNSEMIALILAFNILLDPLITASNVMANAALCRIFEIIWNILTSFPKNRNQLKFINKENYE